MKDSRTSMAPMTIAVSQSSGLSERLLGVLEGVSVEVDHASLEDDVRDIANQGSGRVLLIDRAELPEDPTTYIEDLLCEDEAPTLVVMTHGDDALERARMLAAGASHVIDIQDSEERLQRTLSGIAEAEAEGGLDGPEIRGNDARPQLGDFISRSKSMRRFVDTVERVADADCSLLITGETGVGKERLARAIHSSSRQAGPFVGVNCGALTEALLESQLFGHDAGAFTGADSKHKGYFEQASGGTVFLDEIAEVPLQSQVKLLTVSQRHEVQPLGAEDAVPVAVRVVAATNRDLKEEVREGRFREDLYYRLNVINLEIPPLRRRIADIPDLVGGLIQFFRCDLSRTNVESISEQALELLMGYRWPGNIRELINVVERAMILSDGPDLSTRDIPSDIAHAEEAHETASKGTIGAEAEAWELPRNWGSLSLKEVREEAAANAELAYLDSSLKAHEGLLTEVAKQAKVGTRSLYNKMQRHGLNKADYRKRAAPLDKSKAAKPT